MENMRKVVTDLSQRVTKAQANIGVIQGLIKPWEEKPLFERSKEGKTEGLLNMKGTFPALKSIATAQ